MSRHTETVKAKFDVKCDRCGHLIHAGDACQIIMDSNRGKAYFFHERCPMGNAICKHSKKPVRPVCQLKPRFA